jgi:hypothetical protein
MVRRRPPPPLAAGQILSLPPVAPVAKWTYLACLASWVLAGITILGGTWLAPVVPPPLDVLSGPCVLLCILGAVATCFVLLYKAWGAIQDGRARMTPAAAVLRSLIPIYNFDGLFHATVGFACDFNSLAERHRLEGVRARVWLYWTWYVCLWLTLLPVATLMLLVSAFPALQDLFSLVIGLPAMFVNAVAGLILPIVTVLMIVDMCNAINAVADASS